MEQARRSSSLRVCWVMLMLAFGLQRSYGWLRAVTLQSVHLAFSHRGWTDVSPTSTCRGRIHSLFLFLEVQYIFVKRIQLVLCLSRQMQDKFLQSRELGNVSCLKDEGSQHNCWLPKPISCLKHGSLRCCSGQGGHRSWRRGFFALPTHSFFHQPSPRTDQLARKVTSYKMTMPWVTCLHPSLCKNRLTQHLS